jgi:flagellar hook-length control protein FliK
MTVQLNPDNLGPVTLKANISAGSISIEMFVASADGRDVLRQALPELKRDLAGAGVSASLDLSSDGQSGPGHGGQEREATTRRPPAAYSSTPDSPEQPVNGQTARTRPRLYGPHAILDVLA